MEFEGNKLLEIPQTGRGLMFAADVDEKGQNFQLFEARQHLLKSVDLQYFIQIRLAFTSLQHLEPPLLRHLVQFLTFINVDFLFSSAP
jgi:hypothetical protein